MKLKVIIVFVIISIIFSGCTGINSNIVGQNSNEDKKVTTSTVSKLEQTTETTTSYNYSTFTGDWFCKDKKTSLNLKVDQSGNVEGCIVTVVSSHVPSSSISGTIENNVLTSKLYIGDRYTDYGFVGTLILSFADSQILKGTVKLDKPDWLELAEGDMSFEKY